MMIKQSDIQRILPHAALIGGAVLLMISLFALVRSEEANTRDTVHMQEVIGVKQALHRYYLDNAAYPTTFTVPAGTEYVARGTQGEGYEIRFTLETDLFAKKGMHVLTSEGMR